MIDAFTSPFSITAYEIGERPAIRRSFRTQWPIWISFQNGAVTLNMMTTGDDGGRGWRTRTTHAHWNEWAVYIEEGTFVHNPIEVWLYGEWQVTTESGGPFDLVVQANRGP